MPPLIQPAKVTSFSTPSSFASSPSFSRSSPSPAMTSRRRGQSRWARAKPRTRVDMSFTGFNRAAMPTTTLFSSTSAPRERR